jgi:2-oxoglutarate ferredoxin oxidoreductase subunit beta
MGAELKAADFTTDQDVRWCPGCGDYAILKAVRSTLAKIGTPPHQVAMISGIGCAARFPYYVNSYGFHTIHGRAPAVATGLKIANPDLDVWVVGGDGDFLSIGGNHLLHALRRNVDLNLLLINNAIYGLTKGQYSPTSGIGTLSPSSPSGSVDTPVNAARFALGAGARFVARTADTLQRHQPQMLERAHAHKGASLVEIFQNCIVYNDNVWGDIADKKRTADSTIQLQHGEPMLFGNDREKGLVFDPAEQGFRVVTETDGNVESLATVHDETNLMHAHSLAELKAGMPVVLGVIYCAPAIDYTTAMSNGVPYQPLARDDLQALINGNDTWQVE